MHVDTNHVQILIVFSSDPGAIAIQASKDYNEGNKTRTWSTLERSSSGLVYEVRNSLQDIIFDNSVIHGHCRIMFRRKDNFNTMKLGHIGVVESFLKTHSEELHKTSYSSK